MGGVYHIHHFYLGRKFLLSSCVQLLVVITMRCLFLVFGIQFTGLFEHPAFSVGVVGWFIGGAVNLTRAIKYAVQTGWARIVSFEWLFPLAGLGATKSGINYRVISIVIVV